MSKGLLTLTDLKAAVNLCVGFFETSTYDLDSQMATIAGNFDSAGCSAGYLQFNFGAANRLNELWQYMINNYDVAICQPAFGTNTTEYNTWKTAVMSATQSDKTTFGANITDPNNNHKVVEPYNTALGTIMKSAECKAKYAAMADQYYWGNPYDLFRQYTCTSRAALASLYDCYINKGRYYPCNLVQTDFDAIDANASLTADQKEAQKIAAINNRANNIENGVAGTSINTFKPRRDCMANQTGSYYGATYNPEPQFNINQEPGIPEKTATTGIRLGNGYVDKVMLGTTQLPKNFWGGNRVGADKTQYLSSKAPTTQFRTNQGSYAGIGAATSVTLNSGDPILVDVTNFVACRTYYTTDGSTPTTASPKMTAPLTFTASCTLKTLTVSVNGVAEAVKTLTVTVAVPSTKPNYRYLRILGYGSAAANDVTSRIIEFEVMSGGTNRMTAATMLSSDAINNTGTLAQIKDGVKTTTSNSYPLWWTSPVPNAHVVIDLGAQYVIDSMAYYSYSVSGDQRANRFKIEGSNTNNGTDWASVWDMSANTTVQPILPSGFTTTFS